MPRSFVIEEVSGMFVLVSEFLKKSLYESPYGRLSVYLVWYDMNDGEDTSKSDDRAIVAWKKRWLCFMMLVS